MYGLLVDSTVWAACRLQCMSCLWTVLYGLLVDCNVWACWDLLVHNMCISNYYCFNFSMYILITNCYLNLITYFCLLVLD